MDLFKYSSIFQKVSEIGPGGDPFSDVLNNAEQIIQRVLADNRDYYSKEYFAGNQFTVSVVDGDPSESIVYIKTNPHIQPANAVEMSTNVLWFENELTDKVSPLGVSVKVRD